jgi:hypothetical protein
MSDQDTNGYDDGPIDFIEDLLFIALIIGLVFVLAVWVGLISIF